jgi:hypothetical protein
MVSILQHVPIGIFHCVRLFRFRLARLLMDARHALLVFEMFQSIGQAGLFMDDFPIGSRCPAQPSESDPACELPDGSGRMSHESIF